MTTAPEPDPVPIPFLTYDVCDLPGLSGAKAQAVMSADRPICAMFSAMASQRRGNSLRGEALGMSNAQVEAAFRQACADENVRPGLVDNIMKALSGEKIVTLKVEPRVGDQMLDPYQVRAIHNLTPAGGVFGLDMGLGKTVASVVAAWHASGRGYASHERCWIVCPLNAMGTWEPYVPFLQKSFDDVRILSIDSAHKFSAAANVGGVLILDEAHLLGSPKARRSLHCHKLRLMFDFCICNTGTLLHAGMDKCLSILDLAVPGAAAFASTWRAAEHFKCLKEVKKGKWAIEDPDESQYPKIAEWLSTYVTILDTDSPSVKETLNVPAQHDETVFVCEPWPSVVDTTVAIVDAKLKAGEELPSAAEAAHLVAREGISAKLAWVKDHMDDSPVVIFAHYTDSMDAAQAWCEANGFTFRRIDGGTDQEDRPGIEKEFRDGKFQVLLGQMRAAGISLNLQRSHISIALDFSWNPIDYAQAKRRTRRRGQTHECYHFDLCANRLQYVILQRIRAGLSFNSKVAAFQDVQRAVFERAARVGVDAHPAAPPANPSHQAH